MSLQGRNLKLVICTADFAAIIAELDCTVSGVSPYDEFTFSFVAGAPGKYAYELIDTGSNELLQRADVIIAAGKSVA